MSICFPKVERFKSLYMRQQQQAHKYEAIYFSNNFEKSLCKLMKGVKQLTAGYWNMGILKIKLQV